MVKKQFIHFIHQIQNRKFIVYILSLILIIWAGIFICGYLFSNYKENKDYVDPFLISINDLKIINEANKKNDLPLTENQKSDVLKYLVINISIKNTTDQEYKNVQYSLKLNEEIKPFIASGITTFESDKFWVTTEAIAAKSVGTMPLKVSGFVHDWNLLLTNESDLVNYQGKNFNEIFNNLKSIEVQIVWPRGIQKMIIPIKLEKHTIN